MVFDSVDWKTQKLLGEGQGLRLKFRTRAQIEMVWCFVLLFFFPSFLGKVQSLRFYSNFSQVFFLVSFSDSSDGKMSAKLSNVKCVI